jgi:molybdopterin converting factor small subunit
MHNSPISKEFYNNISNVLMGKTTVKVELPASLTEAANAAAKELRTLTEGTIVAETKRDILRKHLKEGVAKCGCQLTGAMVSRFEEVVSEAEASMLATAADAKKKTTAPSSKPSAEPTKLATPAKAAAGVATAGMKKEETETSEIETGLREFLTQLSEEEVSTLRKIINENH